MLPRFFTWIIIVFTVTIGASLWWKHHGENESEASVQISSPQAEPIATSLRGYWKLDTGSGTTATDSSGNSNDLSFTGSPSWTTGNIGPYCLDFSGTGQYLSVSDPSSGVLDIPDGSSFSISGWFNRDTFTADHTIVAKKNDQSTNQGYIIYIDDTNDDLVFEASDGTDTYTRTSTSTFTSTGWHSFTVTWNDSATTDPVNIYIDGALDQDSASGTFSSVGSLANALAFTIGAESDAGNLFDGKLDDIKLYGFPLSGDEASKLSQTTSPIESQLDSGLVGYWTFDGMDIYGSTVLDRSGHGNDGAITGAVPIKGKMGQGLELDGTDSDYILVYTSSYTDNSSLLDFYNTDYSVAAWIYLRSYNPTYSTTIFGRVGDSYPFYGFDFRITGLNGDGSPTRKVSLSHQDTTPSTTFSVADVTLNVWHHIAGVYSLSGGTTTYYIDGVFDSTSSIAAMYETNIASSSTYTCIGIDCRDLIGFNVDGKLDDIRVYRKALSASEVLSLYNQGV